MSTTETSRCPVCGSLLEAELSSLSLGAGLECPKPYCKVSLEKTDAKPVVRTFGLVQHASYCVLPFSFVDQEPTDIYHRLGQESRWSEQVFSPNNPEDVDRIEYFLPYIREFLFANADRVTQRKGLSPEGACSRWVFDLGSLGKPTQHSLPFEFSTHDVRKDLHATWNMELEQVKLLLFGFRVGFLVLGFRNADPRASLFDQMNALNFLHPIVPLYQGYEMADLTLEGRTFKMPQLLGYLLREFATASPKHPADVPFPGQLPVRTTFDDRMMVYSFSCVDKTTAPDDIEHAQKLLHRCAVINLDKPQTPPRDVGILADPDEHWLHTRWEGFSKEGSCLVVFDTDKFHQEFLGVYHATYYFDIFLLATLQRVTLLSLYERLSDVSALTGGAFHRKNLRRVQRDLLLFKNQCCFSQITNREKGLVLWRGWQHTFENSTLLDEVNEQATELGTYLQNRMRERVEGLVRLGGFLAATVPIVLGLQVLFPSETWGVGVQTLQWILLLLLIAGSGLFACFMFFRSDD